MSYRKFLNVLLLVVFLGFMSASGALAQQVPLNPNRLPQFKDPLPDLSVIGGPIETISAGAAEIPLTMQEFKANVMPTGFVPAAGTYTGTWTWGYRAGIKPTSPAGTYIGPVIIATRGVPTKIRYINNLGDTATSQVLAYTQSTDQTLHWANPANVPMTTMTHYSGPIPAVPHLHGGEVPPWLDGGPDAWFLSNAYSAAAYPTYSPHGAAYYTSTIAGDTAAANEAIFWYPNDQEPANIWFHDHTLGATRLNVYAGIAGAYPIVDPTLTFYSSLPAPIVPLVIQDRMFDVNGQLFFPNVGLNPAIHPFWMPEFIGDTILVNGKVWPFMNVAPQRYRFLFLNGSNARTYELFLINKATGVKGPVMWQIGTDGGYLDYPALIDPNAKGLSKLVVQPGERADVIIDFTGQPVGTTLLLANTAKAPYPAGAPPQGSTTGRIMQFKVGAANSDTNHSAGTFVPSTTAALRGGNGKAPVITRLPGVPAGVTPATPAGPAIVLPPSATANVQKIRQLTLNEIMGPAGPQEILVNNTKWSGIRPDMMTPVPGYSVVDVAGNYITEYPNEGDTEVWDIINTTADTHPIHTHLTQFQIISRQDFDLKGYLAVYGAAFQGGTGINMLGPGTATYAAGVYIPGFGPPYNYDNSNNPNFCATAPTTPCTGSNAPITLGGNPDVTPFLNVKKGALPPAANEMGWKDTIQVPPGQVTRIAIRFSPINSAAGTPYKFNPGGADYVWHCHIIDHEDNEMMRPYQVNPMITLPPGFSRTYVKGSQY